MAMQNGCGKWLEVTEFSTRGGCSSCMSTRARSHAGACLTNHEQKNVDTSRLIKHVFTDAYALRLLNGRQPK
jgi:hypothetical protein